MNKKTLGILGGLGPMSSVYFYEMLTLHTKAACDQEHLNILMSSRADTPDRTAFIMGTSPMNPIYTMKQEVAKLTDAGADIIAIPCNTAHYFYDEIAGSSAIPIINIIRETVGFCRHLGIRRAGVLATEGTVRSEAYARTFAEAGIEYMTCSESDQNIISDIIYGAVKQGRQPDIDAFLQVADSLTAGGCEKIILGCTELSLLKRDWRLGTRFIDSLEVLSACAISACGGTPQGFDRELSEYAAGKLPAGNKI